MMGIRRAMSRNGPCSTLMEYIIPPTTLEIPCTIRSITLTAGNITKLNLTSGQRRSGMDATGKGVTELNIHRASTGGLSEQSIDQVGGEFFKSASVVEQYHTCER